MESHNAVIGIHGKQVNIGGYETEQAAVRARNDYIDHNHLPHQKN